MEQSDLAAHPFFTLMLEKVRPIIVREGEFRRTHGRDKEYPLDEYEYYVERVGNRLSLLDSQFEKLHLSLMLLANYHVTPSMKLAGFDRGKHIRYHLEDYYVRTQTITDMLISLVDAVFHLTNDDSQCRASTVLKNLKVQRTKVPAALKPLTKAIAKFENARHSIVHGRYYQDPDLYKIELYSNILKNYEKSKIPLPSDLKFVPNMLKETTREYVANKKRECSRFSSTVRTLIFKLFDELLPMFEEQIERLKPPDEATQV